jgi:hypothetical protein
MMGIKQWIRGRLDPPRFCRCGEEMGIDAVVIHDRRTGKISRYLWAVGCPKADISFKTNGSASGNGYAFGGGHDSAIDCGRPSWAPDEAVAYIEAQADDFGLCRNTVEAWGRVLRPGASS